MKIKFKMLVSLCVAVAMILTATLGIVPTSHAVAYSGSTNYMNGPYYTKLQAVTLTGDNRTDIVNVAKSQVGYQEANSSAGWGGTTMGSGNYTEYGRWYGMDAAYWCAMFVSWCAHVAGIPTSVVKYHSYTETQLSFFKNLGRAYSWSTVKNGGYDPQPGDIIFFLSSSGASSGRSTNHIGIVSGYDRASGKLTTVEGNTSSTSFSTNGGCVAAKTYYHSSTYIVYVCKPAYTEMPTYNTGVHVVTAAELNVRSGPSTDYASIGYISNAQRFNALEVVNEKWARINYFGQEGYISLNPSYVTRLTVDDAALDITDPTDLVFTTQRMANWGNRMISGDSGALLCQDDQGITNTEFYTWQPTNDPMAYLDFQDAASFFIDKYTHISIVAKTSATSTTSAALFLQAGDVVHPNETNMVTWNWINDGRWHEYVIDISGIANHTGQLNNMRFDFFNDQTAEIDVVYLRSMRFMKSDSKPTVVPSHTAIAEGSMDISFEYSGLDNYFNGNDYLHPYLTVLRADDDLTYNSTSLIWNYVPASGVKIPSELQGDYATTPLPAGKYKVYLTYNTAGSVNFFHALHMASPTSVAEFTVVGDTTGADLIDGITVNDEFATGAVGTNAKDAADKYTVALGGSKGYITDANGNALAANATLASGMKLTVDGTSYDVVVKGDVDCNGGVNIVDVQAALNHLRGTETLEGAGYEALAIVNGSADCNILAATALLNQVLGL